MESFRTADENHHFLEMPDVDTEYSASYLIGLLQEAGLMSSNGMGPVPISWQEINSWLAATNLELSTWEIITVKELSEAYVAERVMSDEPNRAAPYLSVLTDDQIDRPVVANKIYSFLSKYIRPADGGKTQSELEADLAGNVEIAT